MSGLLKVKVQQDKSTDLITTLTAKNCRNNVFRSKQTTNKALANIFRGWEVTRKVPLMFWTPWKVNVTFLAVIKK